MTAANARSRWLPVVALTAGTLWTVTAELLPAGLLLDIGSDTGVAAGTVGYLVTAWGLAIAILSLPLARLTRRVDRRTVLVAALAGTGSATVLTALAPTYPLLVVARTLAAAGHGLFWALVVVAAGSLVEERYVARAVAVVVAGPTIASVVVIPAATALGDAAGWRVAFALVGLMTVVTGLLLGPLLPRMTPVPVPRGRRDPSAVATVRVAALGGVLLVAHFMAFTFVAPILTGPGALPRSLVSVVLLVFGGAGVVGLVGAPALVRRHPSWALPITGMLLALALLAVGLAGGSRPAELVAVVAWGIAIGALPVVFQTRLLALASPAFRPTAGAVMVVALNLGVAAGAAAGGVLDGRAGAGPLPFVGAALAAAAVLGLVTLDRSDRAVGPPHERASGEPARATA
ncbi:MFS transporter [Nocardioides sp. CER19]|uniref:MFS transporter n=1 Tax=Nocardioides sp. CER19 TaxID=3038538 RepID=UPI0024482A5D|nr:MFS transporter [Nocardioides sp. CER19]MDH2415207.1 MFS transporter [Nocardioides sp. CER19]